MKPLKRLAKGCTENKKNDRKKKGKASPKKGRSGKSKSPKKPKAGTTLVPQKQIEMSTLVKQTPGDNGDNIIKAQVQKKLDESDNGNCRDDQKMNLEAGNIYKFEMGQNSSGSSCGTAPPSPVDSESELKSEEESLETILNKNWENNFDEYESMSECYSDSDEDRDFDNSNPNDWLNESPPFEDSQSSGLMLDWLDCFGDDWRRFV